MMVSLLLHRYALLFTISTVSVPAVIALSSGKYIAYLACPHCCVAHLDTRPPFDDHIYGNCGKSWKKSRYVWRNPLCVFAV